MKSILISIATLATASAIAQTLPPPSPIWTKTSSDADVSMASGDIWWSTPFFTNAPYSSFLWNYDGTTVFYNCHFKVWGSTATPPWSIIFSILCDNEWVESYSGTFTVAGHSYAMAKVTFDDRSGFETWHHNAENYDARRDMDMFCVTALKAWKSEPID